MPCGVGTQIKPIWIHNLNDSYYCSSKNGYVNRFCCRLFAAYFLQMVLLVGFLVLLLLLVTLFFRVPTTLVLAAFRFFFWHSSEWLSVLAITPSPANRSIRIGFFSVFTKRLCVFTRKLKCNDIYYILSHSPWVCGALRMQISLLDSYFLSVMEINTFQLEEKIECLRDACKLFVLSAYQIFE